MQAYRSCMLSVRLILLFPFWRPIVLKLMRALKDRFQHEDAIQITGALSRVPIGV